MLKSRLSINWPFYKFLQTLNSYLGVKTPAVDPFLLLRWVMSAGSDSFFKILLLLLLLLLSFQWKRAAFPNPHHKLEEKRRFRSSLML